MDTAVLVPMCSTDVDVARRLFDDLASVGGAVVELVTTESTDFATPFRQSYDPNGIAAAVLQSVANLDVEIVLLCSPWSRIDGALVTGLCAALRAAAPFSVAVPRTDFVEAEVIAMRRSDLVSGEVIDASFGDGELVDRLLMNIKGLGGSVVEQVLPDVARDERPAPSSRGVIPPHLLGQDLGTALAEVIEAANNGASVGELPLAAAERLRERFMAEEDRQLLVRARAGRDVCWVDEGTEQPLVTIRIATYNRAEALMDLALPAALAQTYPNIEVVVVGDHTDEATVRAVEGLGDPRVRFFNLPVPSTYPDDERQRWRVSGTPPMNLGIEMARGAWMTTADDDDEMTADHVEVLLDHARRNRLEFVWSKSIMETPDGWQIIGNEPLGPYATTSGAVMWSAGLRFMRMSNTCWKIPEPHDLNFYRRMQQIGVHMGFADRITYRYYPDAPAVATWQTVLLRTTAVCREPGTVDPERARRKGIDAVASPADRRDAGLEVTADVPADQFQSKVAGLVAQAVKTNLRLKKPRLDVAAWDWDTWSAEHVDAFALGLIEGFSCAPGQPVTVAFS